MYTEYSNLKQVGSHIKTMNMDAWSSKEHQTYLQYPEELHCE